MKAVEIKKVGHAEIVELEDPHAGEGEVVVKVHSTGICGSDIAGYLGKHRFRVPPVITGHELAGTFTELGEGVTDLSLGTAVAIEPTISCGVCASCKAGDYNLCAEKRVMGSPGWPGSFAEYVVVPASRTYGVPEGVSMAVASLIEPLCVGLHAVERSQPEDRRSVAILGSGTIGLTALLGILQYAPELVVCSDLRKFNLDMALSLGANLALNPGEKDIVEEVKAATGGLGVDACLVAAPSSTAVAQALELTRPKGRIVMIASMKGEIPIALRNVQVFERELVGTAQYTREDYLRAIDLFPSLQSSLTKLITHHITLEQLPEMLDRVSRGDVKDVVKVIVDMA